MSLACEILTAPPAPAGDAQASPSQTSNAAESMLNRVIPNTAYPGLDALSPTGGTNPLVP